MDLVCGMRRGTPAPPDAVSASAAGPSGVEEIVEEARILYGERQFARAAAAFERAANAGHPEAMACLGDIYFHGRPGAPQPLLRLFDDRRGVKSSSKFGMQWLEEAAVDKRDAHGMYARAVAYLSDPDGSNDHFARHWFTQAAEKGYTEAMRSLGTIAQEEKQYARGLDWYRQAVDSGSVEARVDLGRMYEQGLGIAADTAEALRWYDSAAASPRGMWAVGRVYELGIGAPQNYAQAMAWYRRAAAAGSADAMRAIATLYARGLGVRRNPFRARCWYERAAQAAAHHGLRSRAASS